MQSRSVFLYQRLQISGEKNANVSRAQEVCHVTHIFF